MIRKYWGQVWKLRSFDKGKKGQIQGQKKKGKKMITWPLKLNDLSSQRGPSWVTDRIELTVNSSFHGSDIR